MRALPLSHSLSAGGERFAVPTADFYWGLFVHLAPSTSCEPILMCPPAQNELKPPRGRHCSYAHGWVNRVSEKLNGFRGDPGECALRHLLYVEPAVPGLGSNLAAHCAGCGTVVAALWLEAKHAHPPSGATPLHPSPSPPVGTQGFLSPPPSVHLQSAPSQP